MSWFDKVMGREFSVKIDEAKPGFVYREGKRVMRIAGETLADGYAVYAGSIQAWENRPGEVVDETERQRIASNVQQYLTGKGKSVYLA